MSAPTRNRLRIPDTGGSPQRVILGSTPHSGCAMWQSHPNERIIVVDLSQVLAIEGRGLGMFAFLSRWAHDHAIQFNLFKSVRDRLGSPITLLD